MSSSERLRLRMEATTKIIAPRPLKDASMKTAIQRYVNTAVSGKNSDGQQLAYSSDVVVAAKAGCAICATAKPTTATVSCCPIPEIDPAKKAVALQGKRMGCCPYVGGRPPLPECCNTPGNVNTWWANDIPPGFVGTLPACSPCSNPAPEPEPVCVCEPCCNKF